MNDIVAIILSIMLAIILMFQLAIALGAPLGRMAWGGQHSGRLPLNLRIGSAFSAIIFGWAILATVSYTGQIQLLNYEISKYSLWVLTAYFAIGIIMNAVSKSKLERIWAPYISVMLIFCLILLI